MRKMRKGTIEKYIKLHQQLLDYQGEIKPFTPTIREIMNIWNVTSTSYVKYILDVLTGMEMCLTREAGTAQKYYAIPKD